MINDFMYSLLTWVLYAPLFAIIDVMIICVLLGILIMNPPIMRTEIMSRSYKNKETFRSCAFCSRRIRKTGKSRYCSLKCETRSYVTKVRSNKYSSAFHRKRLMKESDICGICNKQIKYKRDMTIDHIIPLSKGGKDIPSNTQLAHSVCNQLKGNSMPRKANNEYQPASN